MRTVCKQTYVSRTKCCTYWHAPCCISHGADCLCEGKEVHFRTVEVCLWTAGIKCRHVCCRGQQPWTDDNLRQRKVLAAERSCLRQHQEFADKDGLVLT